MVKDKLFYITEKRCAERLRHRLYPSKKRLEDWTTEDDTALRFALWSINRLKMLESLDEISAEDYLKKAATHVPTCVFKQPAKSQLRRSELEIRTVDNLNGTGFFDADIAAELPSGRKTARDLYGIFDVVALSPYHTVLIQVTDATNVAARRKKMLASPLFDRIANRPHVCVAIAAWSKLDVEGYRKVTYHTFNSLSGGFEKCET